MSHAGLDCPHVLLALSAHGYGHLAQCAPVINALSVVVPALKLSVCSTLPQAVIAGRIDIPFDMYPVELDPVLQMHSAWEVDAPASLRIYRDFHKRWEAGLQQDVQLLRDIHPDVVLADIPYRILLAAATLDVYAVGLCSLNWAAIYATYCSNNVTDARIQSQILSGYRAAHRFLLPQPALAMPGLDNTQHIGPIARTGVPQKAGLCRLCGISPGVNVILIALGGIATEMPLKAWPRIYNTVWIFAHAVCSDREDMFYLDDVSMTFIDVLSSVDVVITKPGYGTYTEAVCNGVALLTLERPDWPETSVLNQWAGQHGRLACITREQFHDGDFAAEIATLLGAPAGHGVHPDGIGEAVEVLRGALHEVCGPAQLSPPD